MYSVYHKKHNTTICFPSSLEAQGPRVLEVGYSTPSIDAVPNKLYRNVYVLHYIISGCGSYYGQPVNGPCAFLEVPDKAHYYVVSNDPKAPQWEQFWIMFDGAETAHWLSSAGFPHTPEVFPCPYINKAVQILYALQQKSTYDDCNDNFRMLAGLLQLFALHSASKISSEATQKNTVTICIICNYIHDNYKSIRCEDELAALVHLSTSHVHKIFKQEMGITPMQYLASHKMNCAKALLTSSDASIKEISEALGFSSPNYFCRFFEKYSSISPYSYRKKHRFTVNTEE